MADTRRLNILIEAKNNASKTLNTLQDKVKSMQPTFQKMAMYGTAATVAIGGGLYKMTQDASDAQEIFNKFDVVFGDVSDQAQGVAMDLRNNFGLAESSAKDLLASTGDMLTGFGMTGKQALDLAEKTNKLAVDLTSFNDIEGGAERASKALTKALLGEREGVKELGIAILEEDVKAKVASMEATGELTDESDRQKKAYATLAIAVSQSKNAIGDFDRTSESLANKQRVLKERFKETKETIGKAFIPVLTKLVNKIEPVIKKIADWVRENPELAKNIGIAALALAGLVTVLGVLGLIIGPVATAIAFLASPITLVVAAVIALAIVIYKNWDKIKEVTIKVFTAIKDFFVNTWDSISSFFTNTITNIKNTASNIWNGIKDMFSNVWEGIKTIFKTYINFVVGLVSKLLSLVGIDLGELIENIKDGFNKGWDIIKNIFTTMWEFIKEIFTRVFNFYYEIFEKIKNVLIKVFEWFKTTFVESTKPLVEAWKSIWNALIEAFNKIVEKVKEPITNLVNWLGDKFRAVGEWVRKIWDKAKEAGGDIVGEGAGITGMRAVGGPVRSGGNYLVGEKGPEIFTPSTSGKIIPNNKLKGAGGGQVINITVNGDISGEDLIDKVSQGIMRNLSFNTNLNI